MKLSKRFWLTVAYRFQYRVDPDEVMVWGKIHAALHKKSIKRHAIVDIPLSESERAAVDKLLAECSDAYLRFLIDHERNTSVGSSLYAP